MKLRPYQEDIVNQVVQSNDDTLIEVPTGGGKTLIARQISLELIVKDQQVLFVTPRNTLLDQTEEDFKGLGTQTVHGTQKYDPNHLMLISTLQTANKRIELSPDVIIIDEVHYGYSGEMIRNLKANNPNSRIIGLSATPYDKDGRLLKGFGLILDKYDMDYMIENKYLVPILSKILMEPDLSGIRVANNGDYNIQDLGDRVGKEEAVMAVVSATKEYIVDTKKCIVFAVNINHAKLLAFAYEKEGIRTEVLHSELDKETQTRIIRRFKQDDFKLLVSVSMVTMGFNVPTVDMAVIARPTKSQNLYKQMVGRITRLAPGKEYGTLLDCGAVIKNLGLPLEPIEEKLSKVFSRKNICTECGNEKLIYRKIGGVAYWVCGECGNKKEVAKTGGYECKKCNKIYSGEVLEFTQNQIVLNCDCGYKTIISESTGKERLINVSDPKMVDLLKKRLVREYKEIISAIFGSAELMKSDMIKQFKALELFAEISPEELMELDLKEIINEQSKYIFSNTERDYLLRGHKKDLEKKDKESAKKKLEKEIKREVNKKKKALLEKKLKKENNIREKKPITRAAFKELIDKKNEKYLKKKEKMIDDLVEFIKFKNSDEYKQINITREKQIMEGYEFTD